jgi:hypothetical protein
LFIICGFRHITSEPTTANMMWEAARKVITIGRPLKKKPIVVPHTTAIAMPGDIIIAINIATWLASVKDMGSK